MTTAPATRFGADDLRLATVDLYRDIHKGIRAELFALTTSAGALDPGDRCGWVAFADHADAVWALLESHAAHEDTHIDPLLRRCAPELSAAVVADHAELESSFSAIVALARGGVEGTHQPRALAHATYLRLAKFTSAYLAHQALEETEVTSALEASVGVDDLLAIHVAIVSSIPPDEMARTLTVMLPAMNTDDRVELLVGVRATAPAEAFAGVVSLARSVLQPADYVTLARRLDIA